MQFADVYLFEKKTDARPVMWEEIEVLFDCNDNIQHSTPYFEIEISSDDELQKMLPFEGELLHLRTIEIDDDEIPTGYLCYDLVNWSISGKRLIVTNPNENVHKYTLPFH